jgi:two-component system, OmpR family, response regulator
MGGYRAAMARILLVEDEPRLALAVERGLQDELHAVDVVLDGPDALVAAGSGRYDLMVLDWMLPGCSGVEVCRRLREDGVQLPILMLTARDADADVVRGLDAGADDYLTKPFSFEVLLARVHALLRRAEGRGASTVAVGPLRVDLGAHRVWWGDRELRLTAKEYQLLARLARRPGAVVSRDQLLAAAWERDMEPASNAVEVHVAKLRRKIDRPFEGRLIHTVRGIGYALRWEAS